MGQAAELLAQPVERSARRLALRYLDQAEAAHAALARGDDPEALHDFRVALRRLRSALRAYADWLGGSVGKKDTRRLKALAAATGAARDAEVHVSWLERRLDDFGHGERPGVEQRLSHLRAEHADAAAVLDREVLRDFGRERWRLARRLRFFRVEVDLESRADGPPLAAVLARLVRTAAADVERALAEVTGIDAQERAHRARIAAKRLRYLLEPFADAVESIPPAIRALKKLQDTLGDMHDADVLLERTLAALEPPPAKKQKKGKRKKREDGDDDAASPEAVAVEDDAEPPADSAAPSADAEDAGHDPAVGLRALAQVLERERGERFAELERGWLRGAGAEVWEQVREVARSLASLGNADVEIERKYLLRQMPALKQMEAQVLRIEQGYLPGERLTERVRRVRTAGETHYYRTVKLGKGIRRVEVEEETTERVFRRMWPLTRGRRVRKVRFRVEQGGYTWEIDRFSDRRLVLAEVELQSEDDVAEPPPWLRRVIIRDVTDEGEFTNVNLAK